MPEFGGYETSDRLARTGFTAVYLAYSKERPDREYVVKVYLPSVRIRQEKLAATQAQLFLDSTSVQQKMAEQHPLGWAPIYDSGITPQGAYYVTDRYHWSAQHLIDGKVRLKAAAIHRIVHSVTKSLLSLKEILNRPHGNMKASNILLTPGQDLADARVGLSDPLPDAYVDPKRHWASDLRAVGELIHQLTVHRPTSRSKGFQAPADEDWKHLGMHGEGWRSLCNTLLMADLIPDTITLEGLTDELCHLTPKTSSRRGPLLVGILVLLAVLATLWLLLW